ncbi:MAG: 50S ribosomal protein L19e [Candidatus Thalassarchaeaceae archaeon]|jgi:large subunit ribosomal protein L19e|nr:50S ribosomal protein L19e [Candidatus Thalassarchaeaceae archaeon]MDP7043685.1 50S ribosomal protein L19e [Candidatus Thalassarchaeaceae archaeon]
MQLSNQKRLAAEILSVQLGQEVGLNRVWINDNYLEQVSSAVQKEDIRELIEMGYIKAKPIQGTSRYRANKNAAQRAKGRRKGQGKRSGTSNARDPRKNRWMRTIRSQRRTLKEMREDETIDATQYRYYYRKAKGNSYRSIAHMKSNMKLDGVDVGGDE